MHNNYLSYDEIVNYFGEGTIADRYKFLFDKMTEYIRVRELENELFICEPVLQQVVMDYFTDIYRLKEFHKIDKTDITKSLAYEAYWIFRRKPIQLERGTAEAKLVFANEGFITTLFAHEFLIPNAPDSSRGDNSDLLIEYMQHLHYHLKYRNVDKQDLELMLYAFQTGRKLTD